MNLIKGKSLKNKFNFLLKRIRRNFKNRELIKVFGSSNNEINSVFIINLDRQSERWEQYQKEARFQKVIGNKTLLDYSIRTSAIDGKNLDLETLDLKKISKTYNLNDQYFVDPDPRLLSIIRKKNITVDLSKEEIAVALSHLKTWKKIVEENIPYALILEDDVFFEGDFALKINELWQELSSKTECASFFDILYLSYKEVEQGAEVEYISKNLFRPIRGLWWLSGYVLSNSGAKKLLKELPISSPVDLWLNLKFKKLEVLASADSIIFQREDLKSDNNYSILPVLSQIGIQSDKTHLILEQNKGRNPIFVLNYNDYRCEIIGKIISILGYRCCINYQNMLSPVIDKFVINDEPLLFDAYSGFEIIANNYKKLNLLYPNAVFILITDQVKATDCESIRKDYLLLRQYFSKHKDKFLEISIEKTTDWKPLCNFLNCKIPSFTFPNFNNYQKSITDYNIADAQIKKFKLRKINKLEHDVHPWIVPTENYESFGIQLDDYRNVKFVGTHNKIIEDSFNEFNDSDWMFLENSFPSNLAYFKKSNFELVKNNGFKLVVEKAKNQDKDYISSSIVTRMNHLYGRYEVIMKPVKCDGIISAFFLHRNDPWQEIDFEFLGNDTTKALINVYYNPGEEGIKHNYGNRGTPILIDLNFDASVDFHEYAIEWEPHEIRWYIDKKIVHVRAEWEPTPIPDMSMQFFINSWPSRAFDLVGNVDNLKLPQNCYIKTIRLYKWDNSNPIDEYSLVENLVNEE